MNINEEIQKASDKVIAEKLPEMVEKATTEMLKKVIEDIFGSYSKMAKDIKTKIEEGLDVNLQKFSLSDYNALVANAVNSQLVECVNEDTLKPIYELVKNAVGFIKDKTIKLSTIHEMVIEAAKEEDPTENDGEVSFYAERDDRYKWTTVSFDIEKGKSKSECAIEFLVSDRDRSGNIFCFNARGWQTQRGVITPSKMVAFSHLEHQIFRLYSAQVKVEVDETDFENEWYRYND